MIILTEFEHLVLRKWQRSNILSEFEHLVLILGSEVEARRIGTLENLRKEMEEENENT